MSLSDRNRKTKMVGLDATGANRREAITRRWRATSWGIRKALAGIRDPRLRTDIQRLIDTYWSGEGSERPRLPEERGAALAAICETLLREFDDDEQAGAAEIRLVVHKRGARPNEPAPGRRPDSNSAPDAEDEELLWGLRQLLASSGGMIADVAQALETRGDDVDRKGRDLLQEEFRAVEVDMAVVKALLSDAVDWDMECKRLLADEVPPFEDVAVDDDYDDE